MSSRSPRRAFDAGEKHHVTVVAHDVGGIGGMERVLSELIKGLVGAGYGVTVIARTCELDLDSRFDWIRVPGPARPFPIAYPWFFLVGSLITWRCRRGIVLSTGAIIANRADWSTVHFCHHATGQLGLTRASRKGVPYRINAAVARRLSRIGESVCYRPSRTGGLIGVSAGISDELAEHFPRMTVTTIPNAVDVERFKPDATQRIEVRERYGIREDELLAVFVGREWERKRLRLAIAGIAETADWKLLVVGDGDQAAYEAVAEGGGVAGRVLFAGVADDPAPFYSAGDAFLFPTAYEAAALVSYEAAAAGLPLLVTPVNGIADLLQEGISGWLIRPDPKDIGAKLTLLGEDEQLRLQMGAASRHIASSFSWSQIISAYRRLLERGDEATMIEPDRRSLGSSSSRELMEQTRSR